MDRSGAFAIPSAYEAIGAFSEGLAAVYSDGLWKYVDSDGTVKFTVPDQERCKQGFLGGPYIPCGRFKDGLAPIHILGEDFGVPSALGYLNRTGEYVWAPSS